MAGSRTDGAARAMAAPNGAKGGPGYLCAKEMRLVGKALALLMPLGYFAALHFGRRSPSVEGFPWQVQAAKAAPESYSAWSYQAERYIVMDERAAGMHANRFCVAYAMRLATLAKRVFVVPSMQDGHVKFPNATLRDVIDFWELAAAAPGLRIMRAKEFLHSHPMEMQNNEWRPAPGARFTVQQMFPSVSIREKELAPLFRERGIDVLVLRENLTKNVCLNYRRAMPRGRWNFVVDLANPTAALRRYAEGFLRTLPAKFTVVHWRSESAHVWLRLRGVTHSKDPVNETSHHQTCARQVINGTRQFINATDEVILFSDVHRGVGGFAAHDYMWENLTEFQADRAAAESMLMSTGWTNGDALVGKYMSENPMFPGYGADIGIQSYIIERAAILATNLITCVQTDCARCGLAESMLVRTILRDRWNKSNATKCGTVLSWTSGAMHKDCQ